MTNLSVKGVGFIKSGNVNHWRQANDHTSRAAGSDTGEKVMDLSKTPALAEMKEQRDRWYGEAQDRAIRINSLTKLLKGANERAEKAEHETDEQTERSEVAELALTEAEAKLEAYNVKGVHDCPVCGVNYAYWQNRAGSAEAQLDAVRGLRKLDGGQFIGERECSFIDGWNECIDEILAALNGEDDAI